ncbi:glycosyltransferase family 2 protein [Thiorhodococcus minor]|uniref:Glycosyltransferase n=1 Tax=Thiorhodococcus minor TaxID=57489 RepID=A0A6M0JU82_9GAMM|nr:glycosyltransferase family A protein [Thiorhodococcus minor]NEV61130.1 glycosyltransferase [Thiorhodococcus minor]
MRTGDLGGARERLDQMLALRPHEADLHLLGANLILVEADGQETREVAHQRLAWINRVYLANDLEPLRSATDAAGENGKLSLDELETSEPKSRMPRDSRRKRQLEAPQKVSVIVAAWNATETLETALKSLAHQTWTNLEVIVVDDASSDDTAELAEQFAARDPRFRLLRHTKNQGAYAARNTGVAAARGAFITTHDSDDWSHPRKIETQVLPMLESHEPVATLSHWVRTRSDLCFGQWSTPSGWMGWIHRNVSSLMIKRSVFEQLGYWDRVSVNADTEYYYRVIQAFGTSRVKEVLPGVPLAFARHLSTSLTQNPETNVQSVFGGVRKAYQDAADQWHTQARTADDLYMPAYPETRPFPAPPEICRSARSLQASDDSASTRTTSPNCSSIILPNTLFFVHIPKTAGTSFRQAASDFLGEPAIQCDYGIKQRQTSPLVRTWVHETADLFELAQQLGKTRCRLICGHAPLERFGPLVGLLNTLTFVRSPVERVVSHFEHSVRHAGYEGTLDDFITQPTNQNLQSRLLGAAPLEAIGLVGVTERYEESLALINQTYHLRLSALTINCHPDRDEQDGYALTPELRQKIDQLNRSDVALVARANRLLDARRAAFESGQSFVHGTIQSVKPKAVSGFAFTHHHGLPVMVQLLVNGAAVASSNATAMRPPLRGLGAPRHGCVGFDFILAKPLARGDHVECIAQPSGQSLGTRRWQPPAKKAK